MQGWRSESNSSRESLSVWYNAHWELVPWWDSVCRYSTAHRNMNCDNDAQAILCPFPFVYSILWWHWVCQLMLCYRQMSQPKSWFNSHWHYLEASKMLAQVSNVKKRAWVLLVLRGQALAHVTWMAQLGAHKNWSNHCSMRLFINY